MKPSTRLPGFEDPERNAVIAILDLPASAYRDLENSAFNLNQQGLDQLKRESFPFENGIGFLISGIAQQNGAKIYRWSLLAMGIGPSVPNLTMRVEGSGSGFTVEEKLTSGEAADEYLLMGLRLVEGIDPARYSALAGRPLDPKRISFLREEGAVETTKDGRLRVTRSGFPVLDAVVADLAA